VGGVDGWFSTGTGRCCSLMASRGRPGSVVSTPTGLYMDVGTEAIGLTGGLADTEAAEKLRAWAEAATAVAGGAVVPEETAGGGVAVVLALFLSSSISERLM
jgi:hypothetical protein